jgi:hypothetical protein
MWWSSQESLQLCSELLRVQGSRVYGLHLQLEARSLQRLRERLQQRRPGRHEVPQAAHELLVVPPLAECRL